MEQEMVNIMWTSAKFATALGKHEGNIKFILNEQHQLTKEDIIRYLQETYDEVNSILSQE